MLDVKHGKIRLSIGDVERLIKTGLSIDIDCFASCQIEHGATIKRRAVILMHIGQGGYRLLTEPTQGRGNQPLFCFAKITPVIKIIIFANDAIGEIRTGNRSGQVDLAAATTKAGSRRGNLSTECLHRLLRIDIDHAAGVENTIKR